MSRLETYNLPSSRMSLLARYSELTPAMDVIAALIMAQGAGQLDKTGYRKATNIASAFRDTVSAIQDHDGHQLGLGESIALARIKRGFRDAALVFPWPYNPTGSGEKVITLTARAEASLSRLAMYDPYRDFSEANGVHYNGQTHNLAGMLADMSEVANGFSFTRVNPESYENRATLSRLR